MTARELINAWGFGGRPLWCAQKQPSAPRRYLVDSSRANYQIPAIGLYASSGSAIAQTSMEKQAQCELSAIRDTRSALAIQFIRSACNWLALNGDSLLNESGKGYHVCLVRQLSGVQADEAAGTIVSACRTSSPP